MMRTPHASRCRRSSSNSSGNDGVVGDDVDRPAVIGDRGGDRLVVADVADGEDQPARRRLPDSVDVGRASDCVDAATPAVSAGCDGRRISLDQVAARTRGRPDSARRRTRGSSGGSPRTCPKFCVRPAPLGRPERGTTACEPAPDDPAGRGARRQDAAASSQARAAVAARTAEPLERRADPARARAGAAPRARCARRVTALAAAFARPWSARAMDASFRSWALVRFSVPTSVSLSSPRMNASTRLKAMSSWIWIGGLFMK